MKTETCMFSGYKIHPGRGKRQVKTDGKVIIFLSKKCERSMRLKRNPREVPWTVLYRRQHKKGTQAEEISKKRTKRTQKFQRAIGNVTLEAILAKRNQKPEFRKAQREQAVKAAKEKQRATQATKKVSAPKKAAAPKQKPQKPVKAAAPRVSGKR